MWGRGGTLGVCTTECPKAFTDRVMRTLLMQVPYPAELPLPAPFCSVSPGRASAWPHRCSALLQSSSCSDVPESSSPSLHSGTGNSAAQGPGVGSLISLLNQAWWSAPKISFESFSCPDYTHTSKLPKLIPKLRVTIQALFKNLLGPRCPEPAPPAPSPPPGPCTWLQAAVKW